MPIPNIDFGLSGGKADSVPAADGGNNGGGSDPTPLDGQQEITDINAGGGSDTNANGTKGGEQGGEQGGAGTGTENKDNNNEPDSIEEGTVVDVDGASYTVNKDGALVDDKGIVFKTADEFKTLLAESNVSGDNDLTIDNVRSAIGIDVVDEAGKPVTFDNSVEGISAYVNHVIALKSNEIEQSAVNSLFETYPVVKDFINHLAVNNGDYKTFGQNPDRTGISIDKDNAAQQESIIRESFKEFGKGDPEGYIKYLKDSGSLFDEASRELAALQQVDKTRKADLEAKAEAAKANAEAADKAYWTSVKSIVDSKTIGGYQIPETIIINKDGKQTAATPADFYNYLYATDKEGYSQYAKDMATVKPEDTLQDEVLRAYLKFTGGSYKDLVTMAVNKQEVKKLRINSSNSSRRNITITKPNGGKTDLNKVQLG